MPRYILCYSWDSSMVLCADSKWHSRHYAESEGIKFKYYKTLIGARHAAEKSKYKDNIAVQEET